MPRGKLRHYEQGPGRKAGGNHTMSGLAVTNRRRALTLANVIPSLVESPVLSPDPKARARFLQCPTCGKVTRTKALTGQCKALLACEQRKRDQERTR